MPISGNFKQKVAVLSLLPIKTVLIEEENNMEKYSSTKTTYREGFR